jgi:hypothetical protein
MTVESTEQQSSTAAPLLKAAELVKFEAIAAAAVGVFIGFVSTISGNLLVSGTLVLVSCGLAAAVAWGGRRVRAGRRSGGVVVLGVTLLLTVYTIGMLMPFMLLAAIPGWIASVHIIRNWRFLSPRAT